MTTVTCFLLSTFYFLLSAFYSLRSGVLAYNMGNLTELVINAVRERPCLLDLAHENYKQSDFRLKNWADIAANLESERLNSCSILQVWF